MNALARLAHDLMARVWVAEKPLPEPEMACTPRPVVGFFAGLTIEQKAKALAYRGPEDFGDEQFKLGAKP